MEVTSIASMYAEQKFWMEKPENENNSEDKEGKPKTKPYIAALQVYTKATGGYITGAAYTENVETLLPGFQLSNCS